MIPTFTIHPVQTPRGEEWTVHEDGGEEYVGLASRAEAEELVKELEQLWA